jgi:hypothetical protein
MSALEKDIEKTLPCVKIGLEDARQLIAKVEGMKRAALNIKTNAAMFAENADGFIKLFGLIIEKSEP